MLNKVVCRLRIDEKSDHPDELTHRCDVDGE